jgi:hypothetical protein
MMKTNASWMKKSSQRFNWDSDGHVDAAVWRPPNATLDILGSRSGNPSSAHWGVNGDQPL